MIYIYFHFQKHQSNQGGPSSFLFLELMLLLIVLLYRFTDFHIHSDTHINFTGTNILNNVILSTLLFLWFMFGECRVSVKNNVSFYLISDNLDRVLSRRLL